MAVVRPQGKIALVADRQSGMFVLSPGDAKRRYLLTMAEVHVLHAQCHIALDHKSAEKIIAMPKRRKRQH